MRINAKDILIVIPARYKSSRFPGKPLVKINGIEMIKRTYSRCKLSGHLPNNIVVATESKKIIKFCKKNSMNSIFTSSKCLTGTDRVAEVAKRLNYKYYINLQGDEPIFNPEDIKNLINEVKKNPESIVNGYCQIKNNSQYLSINTPKVVISKKNYLMYISRAPIPTKAFKKNNKAFRQVCIYGYPKNKLLEFKKNNKFPNEKAEDIEILRFLEMDFSVKMIQLSSQSIPVDIPSDVKLVEKFLKKQNAKKIKKFL